jgi:ArsR family transcriptional regulator, arsenate/arsenite/antimonite-responsive transcriptional repressor
MSKKSCFNCFNLIKVPARMMIIRELRNGPKMATKILDTLNLTQPTISYHLRTMEKYGMLRSKRKGKKAFYSLNFKFPCKGCCILDLPFKHVT